MNNNCITTYTGRHIDPLHPDPDMICIEDIAHALSTDIDIYFSVCLKVPLHIYVMESQSLYQV